MKHRWRLRIHRKINQDSKKKAGSERLRFCCKNINCLDYLPDFRVYLGAGESKASGADVAGNAQGEREDVDFTDVWEGGEDFFSEFFGRFQVVGVDDIQVDLFSEAVCNVIFDGFSHSVFCLSHGAGLGEGVQLFALNLQNRLQTEHGSDGCCSRSDAAALFQVLQSSYSDIDAGVEAGFFQPGSDLIGRETVFSLLDSLDGRVT